VDDVNLVERLMETETVFGCEVYTNRDGPEAAARIAALEAALREIEKIAADCERINLIGRNPDAKLAGTIRNVLATARALLPDGGDDAKG